ncbi:MAG TPA: hypothetical protein VJ793_05410 [Anaerolineae bacterium]|nr:hypothetical protein [Anaerolineae bacterium]
MSQKKERDSGVNIKGKKVSVGGDIAQGDKVTIDKSKKTTTINRSGGIDISAGGGTINVTGDLTGRDKVTTTTTGVTAEDFAKLFDVVYKRMERLPPSVDKADVREAVETIETEAKKEATRGEPPDEKLVKLSAQSLINMAPDILEVAAATLASPAAGVAAVIRKVLNKAKAA